MKKRSRRLTVLDRLLTGGQTPVFVISGKRKVIFFNEGCETLTGWSATEVLGAACDFATDPDPSAPESITGALCPPPEVFAGSIVSTPTYVVQRGGESFARIVHYFPILDAEGSVDAVLGVLSTMPAPKSTPGISLSQQLHAELAAQRLLLRQRFGLKSVVALGAAMLRILRQVHLARASTATVLFRGESGVGKEHLARVIHNESEGRSRSFVPLDCRQLPPFELKSTIKRILSEGAEPRDGGSLAAALQAGTLYLSRVDSLPRDVQQLVLDTVMTGSASKPIRLMASSEQDLGQAVAGEQFLPELAELLSTIVIDVPPLRQRRDDLPLLATALLEDLNRGSERQLGGFADDVLRQFHEYNWPGNLDELTEVVREAHAASAGPLVVPSDLPFRFRTGMDAQSIGPVLPPRTEPLEKFLESVERTQIEQALAQVRHNKSRAAELLGMPRPRLYRRMEALGIADREGNGE